MQHHSVTRRVLKTLMKISVSFLLMTIFFGGVILSIIYILPVISHWTHSLNETALPILTITAIITCVLLLITFIYQHEDKKRVVLSKRGYQCVISSLLLVFISTLYITQNIDIDVESLPEPYLFFYFSADLWRGIFFAGWLLYTFWSFFCNEQTVTKNEE